jgi:hypothetical protein
MNAMNQMNISIYALLTFPSVLMHLNIGHSLYAF